MLVASGIPFANAVSLDTVRFLTSGLDEANFRPRCFDNLEIAVPDPGETQGLAGDVLTALAGLWSSVKNAWQCLGEQAAALRQEFSPKVGAMQKGTLLILVELPCIALLLYNLA